MKNAFNEGRRDFIKNTGKAGIALTILPAFSFSAGENKSFDPVNFQQQPLPYSYNALEKAIDATTMEIHYTKHAATYAKNVADALAAENVNTQNVTIQNLLRNISKYSAKMRNNAGGHYNHELFWKLMTPNSSAKPGGNLASAIDSAFGSFDAFKTQFGDAGKNRFGSGWAWLVKTSDGKLAISSTPNQDNPLMDIAEVKGFPLLDLDVWEHAYYLRYQNRRPDYINAWWNVVNWDMVESRFNQGM
ncbi:MAG: superoxide dismutase [Chitinophagaceae bacterium]|nr:superoxide dismutase [Chitinophagaceae bacterium]